MRWGAVMLAGLAGCVAPRWQDDMLQALSETRRADRDLVIYFALVGHDASDRMTASLDDPVVLSALARGDFAAVVCDGVARGKLYEQWVGRGEGMGIAVLDGRGEVYAARPEPQGPGELAAFLDLCAASRAELADAQATVEIATATAKDKLRLGLLYLRLGCRVHSEPLLLDAALEGVPGARHHVARLYAIDGNLTTARRWLRHAPRTPAARMTEGYVLFRERRHEQSVQVLEAALRGGNLGEDRQRAMLYLGRALHGDHRDAEAVPVLEALSREGTGSTFEAAARRTLAEIQPPKR